MARTSDETRDATLSSAAAAGATRTGPGLPEGPALGEGETLATRYRLVRLIARGGMGEVYEAEDLELGTRIALKTIRAERIGDPGAIARLKQEILAARKITHPNVVRLFDVGFHVLPDQRELAFITMELLAGETLEAMLAGGPIEPRIALGLVRQMAAGLDAAHAAGIVHRDFKSANVIVVDGRAIVTDFGLAIANDHVPSGTTSTDFVGTPAYMAPEQVTRSREIGPAADVYALGVVMFEMVTGAWPFKRDTALATAAARIEAPAPAARTLRPELPAVWDRTIARCLERDPTKRFARAADVVGALEGRGGKRVWIAIAVALLALATFATIAIVALRGDNRAAAPLANAAAACGPPALPDIYVAATAAPNGTGSRACPLRTVTAALAIAAPKRTIHVAAGQYDRALGEQFPLVIRGETTVTGEGPNRTNIVGLGMYDGKATGGTVGSSDSAATMVIGDATAAIEIAELSVAPGMEHVQYSAAGMLCSRGSATARNTLLRHVLVGPNYGTGVVVGTETKPSESGCNLEIVDSRFHEGKTGIWQVGCGVGDGRVGTGLNVHDSTFEAFHGSVTYPGVGIEVWDCARSLAITHNSFSASEVGVSFVRHAHESFKEPVTITQNRFMNLARWGVRLALEFDVVLRKNAFFNTGPEGELRGRGAALELAFDASAVPTLLARDNWFYNNDSAIEFTGNNEGSGPIAATAKLDFGRRDSPGNNVFRCNAAPLGAPVVGNDIAVRVRGDRGAHVDAVGNRWDHAPPTHAGHAPRNGDDILLVPGVTIDTSDATVDTTSCERTP